MIDEKGQISIDFLLGISLFLIALMFIVQFIPGLFLPGSANEGSLDHTAYRTAASLTEDPGWWGNTTTSNTNWEKHVTDVKRIGLAVDDDYSTKLTNTPNLISKKKTLAFFGQIDEKELAEKLGLYDNVNDILFSYGYNITITNDTVKNEPLVVDNIKLTRGIAIPENKDMTKITRIILLEKGHAAYFDAMGQTGSPATSAYVNVIGPLDKNVTILMGNFTTTADPKFLNITLDGTSTIPETNYRVYNKTGKEFYPMMNGARIMDDDVLCFELDWNLFTNTNTYQLNFAFEDTKFIMPPGSANYTAVVEAFYEPAYLNVVVWK